MGVALLRRILALGLVACLAAGLPAAAAGRNGSIRFEGIAGDGGDATHPGWFSSQFLEVAGLGSGASVGKGGAGSGSVWLTGGGPGFEALVRACLSHRNFSSAEVAFGAETYVLEGVVLEGIHVYGAAASGGASGKGAVVVSFRFMSYRDAHAPKPGATTRLGSVGALGVAPLLVVSTPTPTPPRPK